jgi:hypothetical protein
MEPHKTLPLRNATQDDREWDLADEELDRTVPQGGPSCSTSRPCVCQICSSPAHCR